MIRIPPPTAVAALAAAGLLLAGCSSDPAPAASDAPASSSSASAPATASASTTASPSPTSTLSAAQQQAFDEAAQVVMAYRQTVTDLYSGARTRLNDLNDVATGEETLDQGLKNISLSLREGWRSEPKGAQLVLVSAEPVKVSLKKDPPTVIVRACIDASAATGISPKGERTQGAREELDYTVVKTTYLPDPGWAVSRVTSDKAKDDRKC